MEKQLIAIGAHEDDIETHSGGTFIKFSRKGYSCTYVIATTTPNYNPTPEEKHKNAYPNNQEIINIRKSESRKAAKLLEANEICFWDFKSARYYKPGTLDRVRLDGMRYAPEEYQYLVEQMPGREFITEACNNEYSIDYVAEFIEARNPEIILVNNPCDSHYEHYLVFMLVWKAVRKLFQEKGFSCQIYAYEQSSRTPLMSYWPTNFIDISEFIDLKLSATDCFVSQCMDQKLGIRRDYCIAQNKFWGKYAGVPYAEAFWQIEPFYFDKKGAVQMDEFRIQYSKDAKNSRIIGAIAQQGFQNAKKS